MNFDFKIATATARQRNLANTNGSESPHGQVSGEDKIGIICSDLLFAAQNGGMSCSDPLFAAQNGGMSCSDLLFAAQNGGPSSPKFFLKKLQNPFQN